MVKLLEEMRCAYCGQVKTWTKSFVSTTEARCWTCWRKHKAKRLRRKKKTRQYSAALVLISVLWVMLVLFFHLILT